MTHLSLEEKESIVTKALSQPDKPLEEIAKESGVGYWFGLSIPQPCKASHEISYKTSENL